MKGQPTDSHPKKLLKKKILIVFHRLKTIQVGLHEKVEQYKLEIIGLEGSMKNIHIKNHFEVMHLSVFYPLADGAMGVVNVHIFMNIQILNPGQLGIIQIRPN